MSAHTQAHAGPELTRVRALSALPAYIRAQLPERGWAYVSAMDGGD